MTAAAAALALLACSESSTAVIVLIDADEDVRAQTERLAVEVVSRQGALTRRGARVGETDDHRWPFRAVVVPARPDSDRFLVTVEAFDADGGSVGLQRVETAFVRGATRYVRVVFSADCRDARCPSQHTCRAGVCETACVEPGESPDDPPVMGPCVQEARDAGAPQDAGSMDAGALDGGPGDAGPDAGAPPDGGVPAAACPSGDVATFDFDEAPALPRCPGELPCESSPTGRVEHVEEGSTLAPPEPSPCGGGVLRTSLFSLEGSRNAAYLAGPGATHVRAWVRIPADGDGRVTRPTDLLSLVAAGAGTREPDPPRVSLRLGPDRLHLTARVDPDVEELREAATAPALADRWVCLELSVDATTARGAIDGVAVELPLPAAVADALAGAPAHARAGLDPRSETSGGEDGLVWIDQVVLSTSPAPCPPR